jgi:vacuolar protein sorting-associated protein 13A/C
LEHCKECISKAAQSTKEEQTYFDKLGKRILDNIQLTVSNIHIRWESNVPVRHSWGLTLQAITIDSTDENWKKAFVDRTEVASNLYRLFQLKNLGVYWNSNET